MVDNTQSWQQQFSSYAEYANWYNHYYGQSAVAAAPTPAGAIPSHPAVAHSDGTAATAETAVVAPHTPYYPGYVAAPPLHHSTVGYPPPPTGVPPPVAGSY